MKSYDLFRGLHLICVLLEAGTQPDERIICKIQRI